MKLDINMIRTFSKAIEEIQTLKKNDDWQELQTLRFQGKKQQENAMSPNPENCKC
jgi:hypothetical protein